MGCLYLPSSCSSPHPGCQLVGTKGPGRSLSISLSSLFLPQGSSGVGFRSVWCCHEDFPLGPSPGWGCACFFRREIEGGLPGLDRAALGPNFRVPDLLGVAPVSLAQEEAASPSFCTLIPHPGASLLTSFFFSLSPNSLLFRGPFCVLPPCRLPLPPILERILSSRRGSAHGEPTGPCWMCQRPQAPYRWARTKFPFWEPGDESPLL